MLRNDTLVKNVRFDAAENVLSEIETLTIIEYFDELVMNEVSANIGEQSSVD